MPATDKQPPTGVQVERRIEKVLADRIPAGWSLRARRTASLGPYRADLLAEVASPAGESAVLAVEIKRALEPREVFQAVEQISVITADALHGITCWGPVRSSPWALSLLLCRLTGGWCRSTSILLADGWRRCPSWMTRHLVWVS